MMVIRSGRAREGGRQEGRERAQWDHPRQRQERNTRKTRHTRRLYSHYKTMLNLTDWTFKLTTCSSVLGSQNNTIKLALKAAETQTQKANDSFRKYPAILEEVKRCLQVAEDQMKTATRLTNSNLANAQRTELMG